MLAFPYYLRLIGRRHLMPSRCGGAASQRLCQEHYRHQIATQACLRSSSGVPLLPLPLQPSPCHLQQQIATMVSARSGVPASARVAPLYLKSTLPPLTAETQHLRLSAGRATQGLCRGFRRWMQVGASVCGCRAAR
jgi:hypothetical protein